MSHIQTKSPQTLTDLSAPDTTATAVVYLRVSSDGQMNKAHDTRERIERREIRTVALDPERAPLVRMAFDAYATGEYSLSVVCDMLDNAGLRKRMTRKRAPAPLSRSQVHRMLRDDYYIGVVTWDGAKNPNGRHPNLIHRAIFEKAQEVLEGATLSGNRTHKHKHYLRGSLFCGTADGGWSSTVYADMAACMSTSAVSATRGAGETAARATSRPITLRRR